MLRKGNGQEWFPVQLKWPFLRQQLPYGEWELFHHSPIFTLITILFKIASANLYKCLTKTQPKPTKRTAYLLHLNIKQDQKGQLQSQFLHQHWNHAKTPRRLRRINIRTRDFVSRGTVLLVTTVEASDSRNAPAKPRKTPYAKVGNRLLGSHSIQQEIRQIDITPNAPKTAQ